MPGYCTNLHVLFLQCDFYNQVSMSVRNKRRPDCEFWFKQYSFFSNFAQRLFFLAAFFAQQTGSQLEQNCARRTGQTLQ
jgi:hypothetical protein